MKRAEAAQILFQKEFIQVNFIQEFHWGKRENSKEVFWGDCCSNLILFQLFGLRELTDSSELILSWRLVSDFAAPSSSQGDQSKLGGPEKSMSERSPGIGREERPPIVVVVHSLIRLCNYLFMFTEFKWMHFMSIYRSEVVN